MEGIIIKEMRKNEELNKEKKDKTLLRIISLSHKRRVKHYNP